MNEIEDVDDDWGISETMECPNTTDDGESYCSDDVASYVRRDGKNLIFTHVQDCSDIFADNYEMRKRSDERWAACKEMKHVASIPCVLWFEWEKLGITRDDKALKKAIQLYRYEVMTTKKQI